MAAAQQRLGQISGTLGRGLRRAATWIGEALRPLGVLLRPAERLVSTQFGVVAALAVAAAAGIVLDRLGAVLSGMHVPGANSYTVTDLTDTGVRLPSADRSADVISTWQNAQIPEGFRDATWSVWGFTLVDALLFAPAYALLLAVVLLKLRGVFEAAGEAPALDGLARRRLMRRGKEIEPELLAAERVAVDAFRRADLRLVNFALAAVPLLFLLDEIENVLIPAVYHAGPLGNDFLTLFVLLAPVAWLKWALGIVIVAAVLIASLAAASLSPGRVGRLWTALVVVRPQLLLLVVFAAGLFASDQSADVILRWGEDPEHLIAAIALTAGFGAVALSSARFLLTELKERELDVPAGRVLVAAIALLVVAAVGAWRWQFGIGLAVPAVIAILVLVLSELATQPVVPRGFRDVGRFQHVLPALLGGLPLVLLGLAALRASVSEVFYSANDGLVTLAVLGLAVQLLGWGVTLRRSPRLGLDGLRVLLILALVVVVTLAAFVLWNPWRTSELLGSVGVFAAFAAGATLFAFLLSFFAERYEPPSVFAVLRLKRTPVFVLLLVWVLVAAKLDQEGKYYDVRTLPASKEAQVESRQAIALAGERPEGQPRAAFAEWAEERPRVSAVPVVFVAAAGGGIRAAYWVAAVLDCVLEGRGDEPACRRYGDKATARAAGSVFAASGISGGSLGLGAYATHLRYQPNDAGWLDNRLGDDYIAPTLGWALFADLPLALIRRAGGDDRATILERAFERSWVDDLPDQGLRGLFRQGPDTDGTPFARGVFDLWAHRREQPQFPPALLLSGTKVQDGCRVNGSVFDSAVEYPAPGPVGPAAARLAEDCLSLRLFERTPAAERSVYVPPTQRAVWAFASTEDLSDFVCPDRDVRLSTVVTLSSRFPFVLPSGRLEKCATPNAPAINVVDGGYFDTSAASPLVELWAELEPEVATRNAVEGTTCFVPFFLQIDTGYSDPTGVSQGRPFESGVPLQTVKSARNAREANARQAAALTFSGPFSGVERAVLANGAEVDRYAHIYPRAHPGSKAPLGWTLSRTARRDLDRQLSVNSGEIEKVRNWFNASLECARS